MGWADKIRRMKVRTNADTPHDARTARKFGAEGIGLCRTEHMFFDADRIIAVREMILAENEQGRRAALAKIAAVPVRGLRRHLHGDERPAGHHPPARPAAARVPAADSDAGEEEVAKAAGARSVKVRTARRELHESNPMLGHRGCRLGITFPEIYEMQVRAIIEAAVEVQEVGQEGDPRDHDPAGRHREGARHPQEP